MAPYGPTPIIQKCSDNSSCSHTEHLTLSLSLYILHTGVSQTLRFQNLSVSYMCPCFLIHHFQGTLRGKNDFGTSPIHSGKWTAGTPSLRFGRWPSFSIGWFFGSMLIFRGVICSRIRYIQCLWDMKCSFFCKKSHRLEESETPYKTFATLEQLQYLSLITI